MATTNEITAENRTSKLRDLMGSAGYEISDSLWEALIEEFGNCATVDEEEGDTFSTSTFLDALQYGANHLARDLED